MNEIILDITKQALKDKPYNEKVTDEKTLFFKLRENGLFGLVGPYLDEFLFSNRFNQLKTSVLYEYIKKDEAQKKLIKELNQTLNEHKIKHIFLKGSRLKPLYQETYQRGMGDIDILVEETKLRAVEKILKTLNIKLESSSPAHDYYLSEHHEAIEIHPRLYNDFNPKYKPLFNRVWTDAILKSEFEYELEPTFELLYLMNHLAKHFASSGVGLRSLLDISVYLDHYESKINQNLLNQYLIETNMEKYFQTILNLNFYFFDKDTQLRDKNIILTKDQIERIRDYIMTSGIHGKGSNFNDMTPRLVRDQSKLKVLFKAAFPKYKDLKVMYPLLSKCFLLYPVFILHRLFKLVVIKRKSSFNKIKKLETGENEVNRVRKVFQDLGL